jgi:hypothetical protein
VKSEQSMTAFVPPDASPDGQPLGATTDRWPQARIATAVTPAVGVAIVYATRDLSPEATDLSVGNRKAPDGINPPDTLAGGFLFAGAAR